MKAKFRANDDGSIRIEKAGHEIVLSRIDVANLRMTLQKVPVYTASQLGLLAWDSMEGDNQ